MLALRSIGLALVAACGASDLPAPAASTRTEPVPAAHVENQPIAPDEAPSAPTPRVETSRLRMAIPPTCGPIRERRVVPREPGEPIEGVIAVRGEISQAATEPQLVERTFVRRMYVVELGAPVASPSLDEDAVRRVVHRHLEELRQCWCAHPEGPERAEGSVRLVVDGAGRVTQCGSNAPNTAAADCIEAASRGWTLPASSRPGAVVVPLTFIYDPEPRAER